jgi:hypothetical protein
MGAYRLIGVAFNDLENENISNGLKGTVIDVTDMTDFKL